MNFASRVGRDLGDDLQALSVEYVVGLEVILAGLLQRHDGHFLEYEAVGLEAVEGRTP